MDLAKTLYKTENSSINSYQYKNVGKDLQILNFFWQAVVDPLFQPSLFLPPRIHVLKGCISNNITTSQRHC